MQLAEEVNEYMRAGFAGLWVQSSEHDEAIRELARMCLKEHWTLGFWDADQGLRGTKDLNIQRPSNEKDGEWYNKKPLQFINDMPQLASKCGTANRDEHPDMHTRTLFILKNFHRRDFLENTGILQAIQNSIAAGKAAAHPWCICVLSPVMAVPVEWDVDFVAVTHQLPGKEQLWSVAEGLAQPGELPKEPNTKSEMLEACAGMTLRGAENAFSLSIVKKKPFAPQVIWDLKAQALKKRGLVTLYEGDERFAQIGGLQNFKQFTTKLLGKRTTNPLLYPKGLLLLGVPGSGKSQAVKCLGNETGRRVLSMDMGALRSKFQGETDQNMREALRLADAMQPCILFVDEIEKALSGTQSSGVTDGGTSARVFGTLLTWLNDHKTDVFFVGTCNDISQLTECNPEFTRAERFDGIFFFDLPTAVERKAIWDIYLKLYSIDANPSANYTTRQWSQLLKMSEGWTGAEIKTACRLAAMLETTIELASVNVVPIVHTAENRIRDLRTWAEGRCLAASRPGLFFKNAEDVNIDDVTKTAVRGVSRAGASLN